MIPFLHSMMTRGEVEVDSDAWTMHQWDLVRPLCHGSPPFLQIQVRCSYLMDLPQEHVLAGDKWTTTACEDTEKGGVEEDSFFFDETLRLDDCCVVGPQHCVGAGRHRHRITLSASGVIDILMHPVYAVPSPYIRLWDQQGNLLQLREVQDVIIHGQRIGTSVVQQQSLSSDDNRVASMKSLVMDMHPMLDVTCYTLHICKLRDIMESMLSGGDGVVEEEAAAATAANSTVGCEVRGGNDDDLEAVFFQHNRRLKQLYCLNWLSLVGPSIGFTMRPGQYEAAAALRFDDPLCSL